MQLVEIDFGMFGVSLSRVIFAVLVSLSLRPQSLNVVFVVVTDVNVLSLKMQKKKVENLILEQIHWKMKLS